MLLRWANHNLVSGLQSPTSTPVEDQLTTLVWLSYFLNVALVGLFREVKLCVPISHLRLHELISLISFYTKSGKGQQCSNEQGSERASTVTRQEVEAVVYYSLCSQLDDVTGSWDA